MLAKIKSKNEIAQGTLRVEFETDQDFSFVPGQYCMMELLNPPLPDERSNRRYFSIVNSPDLPQMIVITTRISESGFKQNLKNLAVGEMVEIKSIAGNFILPQASTQPLVFLSGGIGITPFMSMLTYATEHQTTHKITLLYSNRSKSTTAYFDELSDLATKNPNLKVVFIMTDDSEWTGEKRKIDANLIKEYFPDTNAQRYMVVGPPGMVSAIEQELLLANVPPENIQKENFAGYA